MPVLRFADCPPSPWKNGGGITRQLLVCPPAANLEQFSLRVSVADVDSDGPFSRFDGIDRTLALVSGHGLALQQDGQDWHTLHADGTLLHFAGELAISSRRLDGAVRDVNIMTRRSVCTQQTRSLHLHGRQSIPHPYSLLLFLASGTTLQVKHDGGTDNLYPLDVLWLPQSGSVELSCDTPCRVIIADIQHHTGSPHDNT